MSGTSSIEWTDQVWNPTTGCTRVSPGCKNCYAFSLHDMRHKAFKEGAKLPVQYAKPFSEMQLIEDRLTDPLRWRKPRRVFVNSMSDLFHKDVPDSFIRKVFGVMSSAGQHTFQILTKREDRMAAFFADPENSLANCQAEFVVSDQFASTRTPTGRDRIRDTSAINGTHGDSVGDGNHWPLHNVWLGVSIEDRKRLDERAMVLSATPAALRFWSVEPLLEDLGNIRGYLEQHVDWVIIGGESGAGARLGNVEWIRSIVEQCKAAGVACFVKQLGTGFRLHTAIGSGLHHKDGERDFIVKDSHGGNPDEWPEDLRVRQFPAPKEPAGIGVGG